MSDFSNDQEIRGWQRWVILGACVGLIGLSFVVPKLFTLGVSGEYKALSSTVAKKENNLVAMKREAAKVEQQLLYDATGISQQKIVDDTTVARAFFEPAFTWTSGDEYDSMRQGFIDTLGEDNRFVKEYLVENTKVEDFNKIDVNKLKMSMNELTAYPARLIDEDTYQYIAFITYYPYKDESDLRVKDKLQKSTAIVQYTVVEKEDGPVVASVSAWNGL